MLLIENMVRRRLFLTGKQHPSPSQINTAVNRVIKNLESRYGNLNLLRNKTMSERLSPVIQTVVEETL